MRACLRVVRDGAQGEGADADAHKRRVVAAGGRQRALGDAGLVPGLDAAPRQLHNEKSWTMLSKLIENS